MKHLKPFNEDTISFNRFLVNNLEDLKDLINSQLANLYDNGFEIEYNDSSKDMSSLQILLRKEKLPFTCRPIFGWDEVKDSFIPLIKLLKRRYEFSNFARGKQICLEVANNSLSRTELNSYYFSLDNIINDDFELSKYTINHKRILMIYIKIVDVK